MRSDDTDDIDLSQHRSSRLPGLLVIGAAIGVALIAVWVFAPLLLSKESAATASVSAPKPRPAAPEALAAVQPPPAAPTTDTTAAVAARTDDPAAAPAPAAAPPRAETTATTPWNASPWPPQSRGIQVAAAPAAGVAPAAGDSMRLGAVAAQDPPAEPFDTVPLPRKRPTRLIAASLVVPLRRPRPEIEVVEEPAAAPTTFDLQIERRR